MTSPIKYRGDIDGLRAVAVMAVVLHHIWPAAVTGGFVGVDVFFVISGYLITMIISAQIVAGDFSFVQFYERRIRRLFPALFSMLAAVLIAGWFLQLPSDYVATLRAALGTLLFSSNMVFWRELAEGYFAADAKLNPLLHTWSLGVEEQFYLAFPLLLLTLHRFCPGRVKQVLAVTGLLSLSLAVLFLEQHAVAVFFLSPFRIWELLAGSLLGLQAVPRIQSPNARNVLAVAGLGCIVFSIGWYTPGTHFPGLAAALPVLGACAIIHTGGGAQTTPVSRVLAWPSFVYVGLISYSLFLWHWPIVVLGKFTLGVTPGLGGYLALLAASLALGSASYHLIEKPSRIPGGFKLILSSSAVVALLITFVAIPGIRGGGFPQRINAAANTYDLAGQEKIPFIACDGQAWCRLGSAAGDPEILLFGDSHMLVWGSGFDLALKQRGLAADFVPLSGCPPVFKVERIGRPDCARSNESVRKYLARHPSIKYVVMAARWEFYEEPHMIRASSGKTGGGQTDLLLTALGETVSELQAAHRTVLVIGQVPVYPSSVPSTLALEAWHGLAPAEMSIQAHSKETPDVGHVVEMKGGQFVDPAQWMCAPICVRQVNGVSLYKDKDHLSVAGSLRYAEKLGLALDHLRGLDPSPSNAPGSDQHET